MNIAQKIIEAHKLKFGSLPPLQQCSVSGSALINADCMDILPLIPDKSVQLILADLPYGTTNLKWDSVLDLNKLWIEYERIITDNGAIILTASQPFTTVLINSNPALFKYEWIWLKDKPNNFALANKMPMKYHENVLVFYKKQPKYNKQMEKRDGGGKRYKYAVNYENQQSEHLTLKNGAKFFDMEFKNPSSVQKFSTGRRQDLKHPTQKPLEMMKYFIATYSDENDYVLDNTMGVGTTCLAAKELNRKFIGIEKEVKYYDLAVARVFG